MSRTRVRSVVLLGIASSVSLALAACRSGPASKQSAPQEPPSPGVSVPSISDPQRGSSHRCALPPGSQKQASVVAELSSSDRGPDDCALYDFLLFSDGCYSILVTGLGYRGVTGHVAERIATRFVYDAEAYGLGSFQDELRTRKTGCPLVLTIHLREGTKTIRFDPVYAPVYLEDAKERGNEFLFQLVVTDLLSKRLLDVMSSAE